MKDHPVWSPIEINGETQGFPMKHKSPFIAGFFQGFPIPKYGYQNGNYPIILLIIPYNSKIWVPKWMGIISTGNNPRYYRASPESSHQWPGPANAGSPCPAGNACRGHRDVSKYTVRRSPGRGSLLTQLLLVIEMALMIQSVSIMANKQQEWVINNGDLS